jgi:1-acyl-sn-glycerol-3-phosphate acyltransferase
MPRKLAWARPCLKRRYCTKLPVVGQQAEGPFGWIVDRMIRSSIRSRFRNLYWLPPSMPLNGPVILAANHHGWHDGYVMYHAVTQLHLPSMMWVEEFQAFPLFRHVGAMPFPRSSASDRAATIRKTVRQMQEGDRSLVIFPEGVLHRGPALLPFAKSLEFVAEKVPKALVIPVALRYDASLHERPECFIGFGDPVERGKDLSERTRLAVKSLLDIVAVKMAHSPDAFALLATGKEDVNERWDMRGLPGSSRGGR